MCVVMKAERREWETAREQSEIGWLVWLFDNHSEIMEWLAVYYSWIINPLIFSQRASSADVYMPPNSGGFVPVVWN